MARSTHLAEAVCFVALWCPPDNIIIRARKDQIEPKEFGSMKKFLLMEPESSVKTLNVNQNKIIKNLQTPPPPPQKNPCFHVSMFGKAKKRYTFLFNILRILNAIVILTVVVEHDEIITMVETHLNLLSFRL